jgi:hypothetical protein
MEDERKCLSSEEEQRADALERLLQIDVGAKEKMEVERYLAKLRHTDEDILPEGDKFYLRTVQTERGVADGQGGNNKASLSQIRQRLQARSDVVDSPQVGNSSKVPLLRAEIEKLTQANSLLRKRESAASNRVEQLEAEKSNLVRSQAELQKTCDTLKNKTSQDDEQQGLPQTSLDSLEQLLSMRDDSSQSQLSTIAEDAEGEKQITALQEERDDMEKRVSTLRRDVEVQRSLKEAAERDRVTLKANIDQLETEVIHLRTENTHLTAQLQSLKSNKRSKSPANKSMSGSDPQITSTVQAQAPTTHHSRSLSLGSGYMVASAATSQAGTGGLTLSGEKWGSGVSASTSSLPNSSSVTPLSHQALSPFGSESNLDQDHEMLMVSPELQQSLADSLRGCSNMQQLIQAVLTYSTGAQSDRFRHALIEKERLQARLSKLESESDLLRLSLGECKDYAEYYSLISRQYESNNTILTACLYFTSRVVQIYEKVLGLVEADMGVMNVACRMAGVRNPHELVGNTAKQAWGCPGSGAR